MWSECIDVARVRCAVVVMAGERELLSNGVQKEGVIDLQKSPVHAGMSRYFLIVIVIKSKSQKFDRFARMDSMLCILLQNDALESFREFMPYKYLKNQSCKCIAEQELQSPDAQITSKSSSFQFIFQMSNELD